MADYPCDMHQARYAGPSHRAYLNVYREEEVASWRASVCGGCLDQLLEHWLAAALHKDSSGRWVLPDPTDTLEGLWEPRTAPAGPR